MERVNIRSHEREDLYPYAQTGRFTLPSLRAYGCRAVRGHRKANNRKQVLKNALAPIDDQVDGRINGCGPPEKPGTPRTEREPGL